MKFSVFQLSRLGGRQKNEDRMGYCYTREAGLFVLADGMGGHPQGDVAAQIALQALSSLFQREARPRLPAPSAFLGSALLSAHHQIIRYASGQGLIDTPRTTLVAGVVQSGELHWVSCGDSRLYVVRGGTLLTRTRDHSFIEAQTRGGGAPEGVNRHVLYTCLGSTLRPVFDTGGPLRLTEGDKVLLCSDGLWGSLPDEQIVHALGTQPVARAVPALVDAALQAAGERSDNVTVLAFEWETPANAGAPRSGFTETGLMSDDVFASTILAGHLDPLLEDMDEDAIERSIAEINDAIQRTKKMPP
ncbi:PP2C family serine/threonine-protein phosphatase [Ottowia sp.]|uniref:PP2C family protein-serine/threonine phosphatase n=1 Tax=Ottowia sp. TaxID=1898956 RepID=UPI002C207947|nr:PP2C family serine/threonine-protein phosphatase [Ottowia sp.]HOB67136.1 serine/threonine-protein phosphatase [Ottowia sp.]HPZ57599.1 serine/threonine-protein phosphatase [Ottowia sp.]HQD48515.1 serine/threonine-protein phosphatase [Ottowia sp.]